MATSITTVTAATGSLSPHKLKRKHSAITAATANEANSDHVLLAENRLGKRAHPLLVKHVNKIELDDELVSLREYVLTDLAHAVMLTQTGIFKPEHGREIVQALLDLRSGDTVSKLVLDPAVGTLGLQIEKYLESTLGSRGLDIQRARSRIDQKATNWRLINRKHVTEVIEQLISLATQILATAHQYQGALLPGYTHLQHSQPTTLDHYLNAHYWSISRNIDRLIQAYDRLNVCPLGSAAYSGTSWPIDRDTTSNYLGFDGPIHNARDAGFAAIDMGAELDGTLTATLSCISRLASDINYWASSEVSLLRIDASLCGTSSMMPQKRNPMVLERIRGLAGVSVGWAASQFGVLHTSTSTDVDQSYVHNLIPGHCEETAGAIELLREIIGNIEFDLPKMRISAGLHWSTASALADHLVASSNDGLSFREAHEAVAQLVAAHERASMGDRLQSDLIPRTGPLSAYAMVELEDVLRAETFIETRISAGGTAAKERKALADAAGLDLEGKRGMLSKRIAHIDQGLELLLRDAKMIAASI